jgi:hypothetical protein
MFAGYSELYPEGGGGFTPVISDVDKDMYKEVIVRGVFRLSILNYSGGILEGWPIAPGIYGKGSNGPLERVTVADINNDGYKEIVTGSEDYYDKDYCIHVYNYTGKIVPGWPARCSDITNGTIGSGLGAFTIADIDNDGNKEIISPLENYEKEEMGIIVFDNKGNIKWKIYPLVKGEVFNIPGPFAVGDIDNDGKEELIVTARDDSTPPFKVLVFVLNGVDGSIKKILLNRTGYRISPPVVADINNDGLRDILFAGGLDWEGVYLLDYGGNLKVMKEIFQGSVSDTLSVGDINNDGKLEISLGTSQGEVFVLQNDGTLLNGWPQKVKGDIWLPPAIANIDDDAKQEIILITLTGEVYIFNDDGTLLAKRSADYSSLSGASVDDLDNDGKVEVVVVTQQGKVFVWDFDGKNKAEWPQFQHDPQHTGCYDCDKPFSKIRPQSKLSNLGTSDVSGKLNILIQQYNQATNSWTTLSDKSISNYPVTVKGNGGIVKLDKIFNPKGITLSQPGKYRVVASFVSSRGTKVESNWEFGVV